VRVARAELACQDMEVSLLLTGDDEIGRLHGEFFDDATPTDVICFPDDGSVDLVVSVECARREARRAGHYIRAELALYIVHGLLHACGFDDLEPVARRRMRDEEQRILRVLGLRVAPVDP